MVMDIRLHEGQDNIESIYWPDESCVYINPDTVDMIIVTMEAGQTEGVPWLCVWKDGRITSKHNAAHVASIYFKKEES